VVLLNGLRVWNQTVSHADQLRFRKTADTVRIDDAIDDADSNNDSSVPLGL